MPKIDLPPTTYTKLEGLARERGVTVEKLTRELITEALKKERATRSGRRLTPEEVGYRSFIHGHKPGRMPKDLLREPGPKVEDAVEALLEMRRKRA